MNLLFLQQGMSLRPVRGAPALDVPGVRHRLRPDPLPALPLQAGRLQLERRGQVRLRRLHVPGIPPQSVEAGQGRGLDECRPRLDNEGGRTFINRPSLSPCLHAVWKVLKHARRKKLAPTRRRPQLRFEKACYALDALNFLPVSYFFGQTLVVTRYIIQVHHAQGSGGRHLV